MTLSMAAIRRAAVQAFADPCRVRITYARDWCRHGLQPVMISMRWLVADGVGDSSKVSAGVCWHRLTVCRPQAVLLTMNGQERAISHCPGIA